jgi:hypothetical protein
MIQVDNLIYVQSLSVLCDYFANFAVKKDEFT